MNHGRLLKIMLHKKYSAYLLIFPILAAHAGVNFPVPNSGLVIKKSIRNENKSTLSDYSNKELLERKGYIESRDPSIQTMLLMGEPNFEVKELSTYNISNTELTKNLSDIQMNKEFKKLQTNGSEKIIGYAPIDTVKDEGWTGLVEFFKSHDLGICKLESLNPDAVQLYEDFVNYEINNKPTTISDVNGSKNFGFVYEISWFDNKPNHLIHYRLKCVTFEFDKDHIQKMIEYAKSIDQRIDKFSGKTQTFP